MVPPNANTCAPAAPKMAAGAAAAPRPALTTARCLGRFSQFCTPKRACCTHRRQSRPAARGGPHRRDRSPGQGFGERVPDTLFPWRRGGKGPKTEKHFETRTFFRPPAKRNEATKGRTALSRAVAACAAVAPLHAASRRAGPDGGPHLAPGKPRDPLC